MYICMCVMHLPGILLVPAELVLPGVADRLTSAPATIKVRTQSGEFARHAICIGV